MSSRDTMDITISIQYASFADNYHLTLEEILNSLSIDKTTTDQKTVSFGSDFFTQVSLMQKKSMPHNRGVGILLSTFEEGLQKATIVRHLASTKSELGQVKAGDGAEFLELNIAVYAVGNFAVTCGLGNRSASLVAAIKDLAARGPEKLDVPFFHLEDLPNIDSIAEIKKHGVKSIDVNVTGYLGSLPLGPEGNIITRVFGKSSSENSAQEKKTTVAKLFISGGKITHTDESVSDWISGLATQVVDDDDIGGFRIILTNDRIISGSKLTLRKKETVNKKGSTYDFEEIYYKMRNFLQEVENDGYLVQTQT